MRAAALLPVVASAVQAEWVQAPGGATVHHDCVHEVESGTKVEHLDDAYVLTEPGKAPRRVPFCAPNATVRAGASAWKTCAEITKSGSHITLLSGEWNVPEEPVKAGGQILYYWNGMQPNFYGVLQPVLQWTRSSGWAIKSWFVGDGGTVTSKAIRVKSGRTIAGSMVQQNDKSWMCTGQMTAGAGGSGGSPATLHYSRPGKETFTQAFGAVLEAYSISTCDYYPPNGGECTFVNNSLAFDGKALPAPLQWKTKRMGGNCGEHTTTTSDHIKIHSTNAGPAPGPSPPGPPAPPAAPRYHCDEKAKYTPVAAWSVGMTVWVVSPSQADRECTVLSLTDTQAKVHYVGYDSSYDESIDKDSSRILGTRTEVGSCVKQSTGHPTLAACQAACNTTTAADRARPSTGHP